MSEMFSVEECISAFYADNTKRKYNSNDKVLKRWLAANTKGVLNSRDQLMKPLDWLTVEIFLNEILTSQFEKADEPPLSESFFEAVKTSLTRLHETSQLRIDVTLENKLKHFLGGYSRRLSILRKHGKMKAAPGGDVIDFDIYKLISEYLWRNSSSSIILFHSLLLNVGTRSDNTSDTNQEHFGRKHEFTTVRVPNTKNDPTGKRDFPRCLGFNPNDPFVCPRLALAFHIFSNYQTVADTFNRIFLEKKIQSSYTTALNECLEYYQDDSRFAGLHVVIHSLKKCLQSYLLGHASQAVSPTTALLRTGSNLGEPHKRYISLQPGGDAVAARMAAGLDPSTTEFMIMPAHFMNLEIIQKELPSLIQVNKCSPGIRQNLPDLVASLVYQSDFIREVRNKDDPIFKNNLFKKTTKTEKSLVETWRNEVIVAKGRCGCCNRFPTGIPNLVLVLFNQEKLEKEISCMKKDISTIMSSQSEILGLLSQKTQIPIQLTVSWWDTLTAKFSEIVENKISHVLSTWKSNSQLYASVCNQVNMQIEDEEDEDSDSEESVDNSEEFFKQLRTGRPVDLWLAWHQGNEYSQGIPYSDFQPDTKFLNARTNHGTRANASDWSSCRRIMMLLTAIAQRILRIDIKTILKTDSEALMNAFTCSYRLLLTELYPETELIDLSVGRSALLKCKSIANKLASVYKMLPDVSNDDDFLSYLNAKTFQSSLSTSGPTSSVLGSKKRKEASSDRPRRKKKKTRSVDNESEPNSDLEDQDRVAELLNRQSVFADHNEVQSHFWTNVRTTLGLL